MPEENRRRLRRTTAIYWLLLIYIIAALVWWFISLNRQNLMMKQLAVINLNYQSDSSHNRATYLPQLKAIEKTYSTNRSKYLGEGSIFFLLILIGAAFVYRSVRKQFRLQQQQQNFMMAVTHELKTPISVARLNLETMQKYSLDPEKQSKLIRNTLDETTRLTFLTNNILISSQLESRGYKSSKDEIDLSDLLKDCVQDFRSRYPERTLVEEIDADADIRADPLLMQMLINNLLANATKYSPKEGIITARLKKSKATIQLQVVDQGPGISESEKDKVFTKFYRIGNESTRKKQGTGLGLYLCRRIAKRHNGDITVTDNPQGGSIFTVVFHT
jgi:two-component system sensor histidine kinase CiaH